MSATSPRDPVLRVCGVVVALSVAWFCLRAQPLGALAHAQEDAGAAASASAAQELEVRSLALVDAEGRRRALLRTDEAGSPRLELLDQSGVTRASLGLNEPGMPALEYFDEEAHERFELALAPQGGFRLRAWERDRSLRTQFTAREGSYAELTMYHGKGGRFSLRVAGEAQPVLEFMDTEGRLRMFLGLLQNGLASFNLFDHHARAQSILYQPAEGAPGLGLYDAERTLRTLLGPALDLKTRAVVPEAPEGLRTFAADGAPSGSLPERR